jgi:OHCU decarboxylase
MDLIELNDLPAAGAERALLACCGSRAWAAAMAARRPFASLDALLAAADEEWRALPEADRREAFAAHPRIGERGGARSEREQAGVRGAAAATLAELAEGNRAYEERFGHVFLICASGRSAEEMLAALHERIGNAPDVELAITAEEQRKITRLRLRAELGGDG